MGSRAAPASVKSTGDELTVPIHALGHPDVRAYTGDALLLCLQRERGRAHEVRFLARQ
jgi:hypothetical protein